jgi:hypothetical protein
MLILVSVLLIASGSFAQDKELKKAVSKSFDVKKGVVLDVENKKGDVEIIVWERNEISIDVDVSVMSNKPGKTEEIIDEIEIDIAGGGDLISVETDLDFSQYGNIDIKVDVDVKIKAPAYTNLEIENKFGDVYIGEHEGNIDLEVAYGNIRLDNAKGESNEIDIAFGKVFIGKLAKLDLEATNATTIDIDEVEVLVADTKFSSVSVNKVEMLELESQYDKWDVSHVVYANVETQFSTFKIEKLRKTLDIEGAYGGIAVKHVLPEFESINLECSFGGVKLFFDPEATFNFDCSTVMGSCTYPRNSDINKEKLNYTNYAYNGVIGDGKAKANVDAEVSQGSIILEYR